MKQFFSLLFATLIFYVPIQAYAKSDKAPVLIELFGRPVCDQTPQAQLDIKDILDQFDNTIVINCFSYSNEDDKNFKFERSYCKDQGNKYSKAVGALSGSPTIIINGRWMANSLDIMPAVKLGMLDGVKAMDVHVSEGGAALSVSMPEIEMSKDAVIYVYAYLPSEFHYTKEAVVDPAVTVTEEVEDKIMKGMSVPFVTQEDAVESIYLRPLQDKKYVGKWDGLAQNMTFSLSDMTLLGNTIQPDLSYVVVVHERDEFGKVLAVGEYISEREKMGALPFSEPVEIKKISTPSLN